MDLLTRVQKAIGSGNFSDEEIVSIVAEALCEINPALDEEIFAELSVNRPDLVIPLLEQLGVYRSFVNIIEDPDLPDIDVKIGFIKNCHQLHPEFIKRLHKLIENLRSAMWKDLRTEYALIAELQISIMLLAT